MKSFFCLFTMCAGTLCLNAGTAWAQEASDTTAIYRVLTVDGNEYFGTIEEQTATFIRIRTQRLGVLTIQMNDVRVLESVQQEKIKDGTYWHPNPQATRYFWAPNGYGLSAGQGYYQNVWVLFNQLSYGFTDNFSMGVGIMPLFLFQNEGTPIWITPKISLPLEKNQMNLGFGSIIGTVTSTGVGFFGIAYGVLTAGTRDANFNFGGGYGFADGGWAKRPMITIGGMVRTSKRGYFISENYYISSSNDGLILLSVGGRFVGESISVDFGGFVPIFESNPIILPWLGIVVPLGEK